MATGFSDGNPYLRELTLKSLAVLGPKLSQKTLSQSLLKHLAKLQVGVLIIQLFLVHSADSARPPLRWAADAPAGMPWVVAMLAVAVGSTVRTAWVRGVRFASAQGEVSQSLLKHLTGG